MIRGSQVKQLSFYSVLYHKIPKKHILHRINEAIELSFMRRILLRNYCEHYGRPAKEPEMMMRIHLIKMLYNLSDERVVEELSVNLAYMWFVGMTPEEEPIHPSLMAKFRTMRLQGTTMEDILTELIRQCIEKGIIGEEDGVSIDATHMEANTKKKVPERIMKHLAKRIFKEAQVEGEAIPDYTAIQDHKEAKARMKAFVEETIERYQEAAPKATADARAVLDSELFMEQKGIRSLADRDARVGSKSATEKFFGYKNEYMLTHSGLITALAIKPGNYVDGGAFEELLARTQASGLKVTEMCGDKAYFRKGILGKLKEEKIPAYIPVSASTYRIDEERFTYNKDSDQWSCHRGNDTVEVKQITRKQRGKTHQRLAYTFDKSQCQDCPCRAECMGTQKGKGKVLEISVNTLDYYEHSRWEKTEAFKEGYKRRAKIEPKNAEQKRFHGLARVYGYKEDSVRIQSELTALATDLKRIVYLATPSAKPT